MDTKICNLEFNVKSDANKHFLALKKGELCFPDINYGKNNCVLNDTPRLHKSIKKINTILSKADYLSALLSRVDPELSDIAKQVLGLETAIIEGVVQYSKEPTDKLMRCIFHSIQFWGGGEGRRIYVRPKKSTYSETFKHNFGSGDDYKKLIEKILKENESREYKLKDLEKCTDSIGNWGLSFASKHMNFISKAVQSSNVPRWYVFDSIISTACFGEPAPVWKSYATYCQELENQAKKQGVTGDEFERALFNYLQEDPVGQLWGALRCR